MTQSKVAKQAEEGLKIGPWDVAELCELSAAFRELGAVVDQMIAHGGDGDVDNVRRALFELTKGLAGTVVAGAPELAGELASSFYVIHGSSRRVDVPPNGMRLSNTGRVGITVFSCESMQKGEAFVDAALFGVTFEGETSPDLVLVRRDRRTNERRVRHFEAEPGDVHFERAAECRAEWLGVSEGPFIGERWRPCT
jgi:hypothetical protein